MDPITMMLGTTALSGGLSLMSGIGQQQSTAKQGRLQMIENARVDQANREANESVNAANAKIGMEYLHNLQWAPPEVTRQTGTVDIDAFMAAGERAGFNPVTWLNSGALSLFADTTKTTTGHLTSQMGDAFKMMMPNVGFSATATQIPRVPSTMEVIGSAGSAALSTFNNAYKANQSYALQMSALERGVAGASGLFGSSGMSYNPMTGQTTSSGGRTGGAGALSPFLSSGLPYPAKWEQGKVEVTNPWQSWTVDPKMSNAEAIEDTYGDAMSWIYGGYKFINDATLNLTGTSMNNGLSNVWNGREWGGAQPPRPLELWVRKQYGQ